MKPKIKVEKYRGNWAVVFQIGNQGFHLESLGGTKAEANWQAKMLKIAFSNITPIKKKSYEPRTGKN